jgi:rhamnosyltransferase
MKSAESLQGHRPSVIVRSKDKVDSIEKTLTGLRSQTIDVEIVVVDSGSTDGTLEIARRYCDELIEIPASSFTYGGSLNLGAEKSSGDVVFALSAHCVPSSEQWVEWALEAYTDSSVAGTTGEVWAPNRGRLSGPTSFARGDVEANPFWGFSNHASSWRRSAWEAIPFDATVEACEDKLWMWRVLEMGSRVVADPRLVVDGGHRRAAGARELFRRVRREHRVLSGIVGYAVPTAGDLLQEWWGDFLYPSPHPNWQRRLSPLRATELLAAFVGDHEGARSRAAGMISINSDR